MLRGLAIRTLLCNNGAASEKYLALSRMAKESPGVFLKMLFHRKEKQKAGIP